MDWIFLEVENRQNITIAVEAFINSAIMLRGIGKSLLTLGGPGNAGLLVRGYLLGRPHRIGPLGCEPWQCPHVS